MAKIKFSQNPIPIRWPIKKNRTPIIVDRKAIIRVTLIISFCKGLKPASTALVRWAMRPNSVAMPVANTTALPEPLTTVVPAKAIFLLSIISPSHGLC